MMLNPTRCSDLPGSCGLRCLCGGASAGGWYISVGAGDSSSMMSLRRLPTRAAMGSAELEEQRDSERRMDTGWEAAAVAELGVVSR